MSTVEQDLERGNVPVFDREPLLQVRNLDHTFTVKGAGGVKGGTVHAVSNVSFDIMSGEGLGLVGETGSGKSTLARSIIQAPRPQSGEVHFRGQDLMRLSRRMLKRARRDMQMVYQDPFGSLNPKWRLEDVVAEPLIGHDTMSGRDRDVLVGELLDRVGLDPSIYRKRRPMEISGGQCQRVAIARAIALNPALVICDEAVSSLDVLIRAQVLNLFEELRRDLKLSYLFIAHDLATVKQISDRLAVMHLGQVCEIGPANRIYEAPRHPYTRALLDSVPGLDQETGRARRPVPLQGEPPSPLDPPSGCRFRTRCPRAQEKCATVEPVLTDTGDGDGHQVACHFPLDPPDPSAAPATVPRTRSTRDAPSADPS